MPKEDRPIELRLDYQRLNLFFADYVNRISQGGTFISTQKPLPTGTSFVFVLGVPTIERPLRLRGKVIAVTTPDEASKANPAGMGIELEYKDEAQRKQLQKLVEDLMVQQLGAKHAKRLLDASPQLDA
jgi:type IV pilus assembly protein PilZ